MLIGYYYLREIKIEMKEVGCWRKTEGLRQPYESDNML